MSDDVLLLANRIRALERQLAALQTQDAILPSLYLLASGARAGAASQAQTFGNNLYANYYLNNLSSDPDSQQFSAGSGGIPAGWTEADAANNKSVTILPGFWYLSGTASETSWQYKKQMAALVGSSAYNSFALGPLLYRDGRWAADLTYRFGIYADNAGAPNQNVFVRVALVWDAAAGFWKARGERKNGTTETDGAWFNLYQIPLVQPLWLRVMLRTQATILGRAYIGGSPVAQSHTLLQDANANYTWGTPWLQIDLAARGAGVDDYFIAAGVNRTNDV